SFDRELERARARSIALDEQIADSASDSNSLAAALSTLAPYIKSDMCPVCSRDYAEVSRIPLRDELLRRIGSLSEAAARLEALGREKADAAATISVADRKLVETRANILPIAAVDTLKTRRARLEEMSRSL